MMVHCPQCSSHYQLPENLLGPGGARVRCPHCGNLFEVPASISELKPVAPATMPPDYVAAEVLQALGARAPLLSDAHARGRLFVECGEALLDAFDEYRRRVGPKASAGVFRDVLRQRFRIELVPE